MRKRETERDLLRMKRLFLTARQVQWTFEGYGQRAKIAKEEEEEEIKKKKYKQEYCLR